MGSQEAMTHMVTIVFTAKTNWISRTILKLTGGKASHVFLEYDSELWGGRWAAEAGALGVRKIPAKMARHHVVAEFGCQFPTNEALRSVAHLVGQRYDIGGLLWFAWFIIAWRLFKKKIKKPLNNTKGQFCSEFVTRFLQAAGMYEREADPELTSPQELFEHCRRSVVLRDMIELKVAAP